MTEGITLLILAVQTGLIELQVIHRAFLLSIILFIVVASILQSMLEIADPIVLALGASRDKYEPQQLLHPSCLIRIHLSGNFQSRLMRNCTYVNCLRQLLFFKNYVC